MLIISEQADQLNALISPYDIILNSIARVVKELQTFLFYPIKMKHTRMRV